MVGRRGRSAKPPRPLDPPYNVPDRLDATGVRMSSESALLRAVLTDPDADAPRRAYADFLADSSRPADQARGEFIHLQLDLAKQSGESPTWASRYARERELLERYRAAWEKQ